MAYTLITGASGGIGMEFAKEFGKHGHDLILVARSAEKLEALKASLEQAYHNRVVIFPADLTKEEDRLRLFAYTQEQGLAVDILVNNAGFGDSNAYLDTAWDRHKSMVELNILALMHLAHLYGTEMKQKRSGKILNVASAASFAAGPNMATYYATKAFVLSLSEALYEELKPYGITVTTLCPGPTATDFEKNAGMGKTVMFAMGAETAEDVAKCGYNALMKGKAVVCQGKSSNSFRLIAKLTPRSVSRKFAKFMNQNKEN